MSTTIFCSLIFTILPACHSWKTSRKIIEGVTLDDEVEVDVYCRNKEHVIRMKKDAEFYPVDTYINNSISMQCKYCEDEDDGFPKNWSQQKHIFTGNVTEVDLSMEKDLNKARVFVTRIHSLIIRQVKEKDMGLYFCRPPYVDKLEKSFNYFLDVLNRKLEYSTGTLQNWQNYSDHYLKPLNRLFAIEDIPEIGSMKINITLFTDWSEWSECNPCNPNEVQTRIGRCRVKPLCENPEFCFGQNPLTNDTFFDDKHNKEKNTTADNVVTNNTEVKKEVVQFSMALACRGLTLRSLFPIIYEYTAEIPDFLLQRNCSGPCKGRATVKGARYVRSIILTQGAHLTLVCPDSTADSQVRWEHNKRRLYPNEGFDYITESVEPRIYVDSFNTLYLYEVTEAESGNYTCFVDEIQMQQIKIIVMKRSVVFSKEFRRHLNYLAIVFLLCFVAYLCGVIVVCITKKKEERSRAPAKKKDEKNKGPVKRKEELDKLLPESE